MQQPASSLPLAVYFGVHEPLNKLLSIKTWRTSENDLIQLMEPTGRWANEFTALSFFSTGLSINEVQSAFSLPLMQHLLRGIPPTVWRSSAWNCEKRWIIITWKANRADQVHTRTEGKWVSPAHFFFLCLSPPLFSFLPFSYSFTRVDGVSEKLCSLVFFSPCRYSR